MWKQRFFFTPSHRCKFGGAFLVGRKAQVSDFGEEVILGEEFSCVFGC